MALLYYWRPDNYRQDAEFGFGFHLNQNSPAMLKARPGDGLWAFTRRKDGAYALAAHLIVKGITYNVPRYRYGKYRLWADQRRSRYFDVEASPQSESIIRSLSIRADARHLGQSFQGNAAVRELTPADDLLLAQAAVRLPVIHTAEFYPEDELEARVVYGGEIRIEEIAPNAPARTRYLYDTLATPRSRRNVRKIVEMYEGKCQICAYDPRRRYDGDICHVHHIIWVSRGGESELNNLCLVCPTHHAAIHMDDAVFDYAGLEYRFSNGLVEPLMLNRHLVAA